MEFIIICTALDSIHLFRRSNGTLNGRQRYGARRTRWLGVYMQQPRANTRRLYYNAYNKAFKQLHIRTAWNGQALPYVFLVTASACSLYSTTHDL